MDWYSSFFKPSVDYLIAITFLIALWPLYLFIYLMNLLVFRKGLFIQERIGFQSKPFMCIKFQSLRVNGQDDSAPLWGKLLRYSSLDELPQMINILRGEMSFIGPRPLLPAYLSEYSKEQLKRHNVKPGISGLAQVNGRNMLPWEESLAMDVYYAENISFRLDLLIVLQTIPQIFKINQVQQSKSESRQPFKAINKND
jgi:lipopolysaccharide/colanic/teichoic acid biosynthesis glycosyltransferase